MMGFDYYYGQEAEQFNFIKIPQVFFTDEQFVSMSCEAKILYGLMLNRMSLSMKNEWLDDENRVYIIYTVEDVMETMFCAKAKAVKTIKELEDMKLIEKNRRGFGQPTLIYVKNFISKENKQANDSSVGSKIELHEVSKSNFTEFENQTSLGLKNELNEVRNSNPNKKDISNIDLSNKNNNVHPDARSEKEEQKKNAEELFERLWSLYPSKKGKGKVSQTMKMKLLSVGEEELIRAIERYKVELEKDASWRKPQNGSTFFCSGYIDYLDANYVPAENKQVKKHANSNNKFHNFEQRTYDYEALERRFVNKIAGIPNDALGGKI